MTDDRRERARAYATLASEYLRAATVLERNDLECATNRAFWALLAHALELALKAHLRTIGLSEERLMVINHGLVACEELAGLDHDRETSDLVAMLDRSHAMQAFRYPQIIVAPEIDPVRSLAIVAGVLSTCTRNLQISGQI